LKNGIPQLTVKELKQRIDAGEEVQLIDVREPWEYKIAQIGGNLIPQNEVPNRRRPLAAHRRVPRASRLPPRSQPRRRHPSLERTNRPQSANVLMSFLD
jgi:adenylyltransferase/sulfurtransferase